MKWEYRNIGLTELELSATEEHLQGIKIIFASNFQYDMYPKGKLAMERETFQTAVDLINSLNAGIILLGGDYSFYSASHSYAATYLRQLEAPLGVFGIFGNHGDGAIPAVICRANEARERR